jgi:hypothetical protein
MWSAVVDITVLGVPNAPPNLINQKFHTLESDDKRSEKRRPLGLTFQDLSTLQF